jgi:hypothetical protein
MVRAKATIDQLIAAHAELGNIHAVAARFGMNGSSVHERLVNAGYDGFKIRAWTTAEDERLAQDYDDFANAGALTILANMMRRPLAGINGRAKKLGLQKRNRPKAHMLGNRNLANHIARHGHPRGMAGKVHTPEAKQLMSAAQTERWQNMSPAERDAWAEKTLQGRMASDQLTSSGGDRKKSWKAGWRLIGWQKKYYRSQWEANYARYLEWLRKRGEILEWDHEPKTFWFEGIRRGVCSYKPDFRVVERNGSVVWHEVKGWMDQRSRTCLNRMAKYFPDEVVIVIDATQYKAIKRTVRAFIWDWE